MQEIITGLAQYDTATVFNALVLKMGLPSEEYTDHTMCCLLPGLGSMAGLGGDCGGGDARIQADWRKGSNLRGFVALHISRWRC